MHKRVEVSSSNAVAESSTSIIEHDEIVSLKTRVPIESSVRSNNENTSSFNMPPGTRRFYNRIGRDMVSYSAAKNLDEGPPDDVMETTSSHGQWSELSSLSHSNDNYERFQSAKGPVVLESFEEQMMLAMAVSLAETRVMSSGPSASW
ncbi:hypothetical protein MTR_7g031960 [Medicago truncatula]|uniref:Uncharacterized protein n=1 Tax=Medicago truncatula TaxID=3880 RepID=G7L4D2_MEDTR|nr:hypothetical protein MTR_7g031960 [Medicago truncatula]